jgi:Putative auto-transporter adhesin, head GIN domain
MRTLRLLAVTALLTTSGAAQTAIPVERFESVALHNGGNVVVRHGPVQRVTIVTGDSRTTHISVDRRQLVIEHRHVRGHSRDHRLEVEVITPQVTAVSVSNGGTLRTAGAFPAQAAIDAHVEQGGRIDIRSIPADAVFASVYSGGGIFTNARQALTAKITSGGSITYWGDARVQKTVRDGGAVRRGKDADADKPLPEFGPLAPPPVAPLAPVPPVPPH